MNFKKKSYENLIKEDDGNDVIIRKRLIKSKSITKLVCISLLLVLMVGSIGSSVVPNYKVYAQVQADSDGDSFPDDQDQCPNDPSAWVWPCSDTTSGGQTDGGAGEFATATGGQVDSDGDGYADIEDQCPNDPTAWAFVAPCPGSGGEQTDGGGSTEGVSMPEDVVPSENVATESQQEAAVCTGSEQEAAVCTEGDEFGTSAGGETTTTDTGVTQYDPNCTNFVELDCGAGATDGGGTTTTTATGCEDLRASLLDGDNDCVDDTYDPCPNDFINACGVSDRDHDGQPNETDLCPDDGSNSCPEARAKQIRDFCQTASTGFINCIVNYYKTATGQVKEAICAQSADAKVDRTFWYDCNINPGTSKTKTKEVSVPVYGGLSGGRETSYSIQTGSKESICAKYAQRVEIAQNEFNQCMANWPDYKVVSPLTPDDMAEACIKLDGYGKDMTSLCQSRAGEVYWKDLFLVRTKDFNWNDIDVLSPDVFKIKDFLEEGELP